eukprot:scpid33479/ scgid24264/ 
MRMIVSEVLQIGHRLGLLGPLTALLPGSTSEHCTHNPVPDRQTHKTHTRSGYLGRYGTCQWLAAVAALPSLLLNLTPGSSDGKSAMAATRNIAPGNIVGQTVI